MITHQPPGSLRLRGAGRDFPLPGLIWLQGDSNYTLIHAQGRRPFLTARNLGSFEHQLTGFVRISRSALINPGQVKSVRRLSSERAEVILTNGTVLAIARRRVAQVIRILGTTPAGDRSQY